MRRTMLSLMLIAAVVVGIRAWAQQSSDAPAADSSEAVGVQPADSAALQRPAAEAPDFTGEWRLDLSRSDSPRGPGGPGRRGPRMGRGDWGGRGGMGGGGGMRDGGRMGRGPGGGRPDDRGSRPVRLPNLMHVTHTSTLVSFEDSTGTVIQEITTVPSGADTLAHAPGARQLAGRWNADRLEVEHQGWRGAKVTDVYALEEGGSLLVIRTALPARGDMPAREFKRVYRRES